MKTDTHFCSYHAQFSFERKQLQTKVYRRSKHTFYVQRICVRKSCRLGEMCKDIVEPDRPHTQMTVWCMRIACCIPKATITHSQYVLT
jgi:hypothetical protein